jgi:glycosyltransferase involved in cell wall biosynthesis
MNTGSSLSISVVMPVHNGGARLDAAIGSIVGQTWRDFEFVILDDASTDDAPAILERWAARDARIRLARSPAREGCAGSSDRVARLATAPVCARMGRDEPHARFRS